jgi:hypothetical protein
VGRSDRRHDADLPRRGDDESRDLDCAERAERNLCGGQRAVGRVGAPTGPARHLVSRFLKKVFHIANLEASWRVIQENARTSKSEEVKQEVDEFADDPGSNLRSLQRKLSRNTYEFPRSKGIPSPKRDAKGNKTGKIRPIVLAPIEARIIQRALLNVLVTIPALKPYFETPKLRGSVAKTAYLLCRPLFRQS